VHALLCAAVEAVHQIRWASQADFALVFIVDGKTVTVFAHFQVFAVDAADSSMLAERSKAARSSVTLVASSRLFGPLFARPCIR